jgi:hypothetical protein
MGNTNYLFIGLMIMKFDNGVRSITKSHSKFCPFVDLRSVPCRVTSEPGGLSFELRPVSMLRALTHAGRWRVKTVTVSIDPYKPNWMS